MIRLLKIFGSSCCKPIRAKEKSLPRPEIDALLKKGCCLHTFSGGKKIFFTLRMRNLGNAVQVNIDAIDLRSKKVAGVLDFSIVGKKATASALLVLADTPFSAESKSILAMHGFGANILLPHNFMALRQTPGNVAFWIRTGYRGRNNSGYEGLSNLLCFAAKEFALTQNAAYFTALDVGNPYGCGAQSLARYYANEFGARQTGEGRNMEIRI